MPPRIPPGSRPRGRPRTRAITDEPAPEWLDDEVIDEGEDSEEDPDWDSEDFGDEDIQEARQEYQEIPPDPAVPQIPAVDPNQFFQYMFQQMQRAPMFQQPVHTDYLALALPHRPPTFSGSADPATLDDWQYKMGRIFQHIGCPENRKVEVAVQFLDGSALQWWRSVESTTWSTGEAMTWEVFKERLRSHFFTEHHYDAKRSEFVSLRQGRDMTVAAYHQRFIELMYYAPDIVPDERTRVRRFIEGLLPEIRACCTNVRGVTLSEIFGQALTVEQSKNEERMFRQGQSRGQQRRGGSQRRPERGQSSRASSSGGSRPVQSQDSRAPPVCWNCGEQGHFRNNCPHPVRNPSVTSSQGSGSSRGRRQ